MIPNINPNLITNIHTNQLINTNLKINFTSVKPNPPTVEMQNKLQLINEEWITDDNILDAPIDQSYKDLYTNSTHAILKDLVARKFKSNGETQRDLKEQIL